MSKAGISPLRVAKWLPMDYAVLNKWLKEVIEKVEGEEEMSDIDRTDAEAEDQGREMPELLPPVKGLKDLIESESEVNMFFHQMFSQSEGPSERTLTPIRNYRVMLRLINHFLTRAPEWHDAYYVGLPINSILNSSMGTTGGYAAFLNDKVNAHFRTILNCWGTFLKSADSCYVLNESEDGWLGKNALEDEYMSGFVDTFKCDPSKPHWGFKSWDDFFTREFREGVRPVASPEDSKVIVNACESAPYMIQHNVRRRSRFWLKGQPYSIHFMMAGDPLAEEFVGGTVYQAFLSMTSYHRWHSPVDGKIAKAYVIDGGYFSKIQPQGLNEEGFNLCHTYITEVATRALVFIQADNPYIGLLCLVAVGMAEVSTCEITACEGQRVKKGQQVGMFHFGGSTYCLVFCNGVDVTFNLHRQELGLNSQNIKVNDKIATVPRS